MPTIAEVLANAERRLFVGRRSELVAFRQWLTSSTALPAVWNIIGRGGVGKSTLARAFARMAEESGRPVVWVDGGALRPEPGRLLDALGPAVAARLDEGPRPVVVIDTFEQLVGLRRPLLETILPRLDADVRTVVAGRAPLLTVADTDWRRAVREIRLEAFTPTESRAYLAQRGRQDPAWVDAAIKTTGGHPLALSMAADVADLGSDELAGVSDLPRAVRAIAEQTLRHVTPLVREALESAATVRRFDAELLAAMLARDANGMMDRLAQLSMIRPAADGMARVHDDVRKIVVSDLRWDRPDRYRDLRQRAFEAYRTRTDEVDDADREPLLLDAFFLMEDSVVQSLVFGDEGEPGVFVTEPARSEVDIEAALAVERVWHHEILPTIGYDVGGPVYDQIDHFEVFPPLVRHPHAIVPLVRDRIGNPVGYALMMPVTRSSYATLLANPITHATIEPVVLDEGGPDVLPEDPQQAELYHLIQLAVVAEPASAIQAALWRDVFAVLFRGGAYAVTLARDEQAELFQTLGFEPVEGSRIAGWHRDKDLVGLVLDLRERGVHRWVAETVLPHVPPAPQPSPSPSPPDAPRDPMAPTVEQVSSTPDPAAAPPREPARWQVTLLGDFVVTDDAREVTPSGQPGRLLRVLAAHDGRMHVETLAEVLWPEAPDRGRRRLRNTLSRLRDQCGPIVERRDEQIVVVEDCEVDADRFAEAASAAISGLRTGSARAIPAARQALTLYRGIPLPTDPFAEWAAAPRERTSRLRLSLLDGLADALAADGGIREAVRLLQEAIDAEPYDEARYVRAARLLVKDHRRAAAVRMLDRARQMLDDLGLPPSRDLLGLEASLRSPESGQRGT